MGRLMSAAYSAIPFRGVIPIPPAKSTAGRSSSRTKSPRGPCRRTLSTGRREAKRAFEWRFGCAHRVFQVRARGGARERHWPSVPAFVGPQGEKGELDGTKREPNWFLHSNPMGGGRKL